MYRNIEAERVRLGLTKAQLAEKLGISKRTYDYRMKGEHPFKEGELKKLSELTGQSIEYLINKTLEN